MFRYAEIGPAGAHRTANARNGRAVACEVLDDTRGTAAIEFAFVIGALVLVVIAGLQFGRALMAKNEMNHALAMVMREVQLHPKTATIEGIEGELETLLKDSTGADADVDVTAISGTNYMKIAVEFPFEMTLPLMPARKLNIGVEALAPMVSPTQ